MIYFIINYWDWDGELVRQELVSIQSYIRQGIIDDHACDVLNENDYHHFSIKELEVVKI